MEFHSKVLGRCESCISQAWSYQVPMQAPKRQSTALTSLNLSTDHSCCSPGQWPGKSFEEMFVTVSRLTPTIWMRSVRPLPLRRRNEALIPFFCAPRHRRQCGVPLCLHCDGSQRLDRKSCLLIISRQKVISISLMMTKYGGWTTNQSTRIVLLPVT